MLLHFKSLRVFQDSIKSFSSGELLQSIRRVIRSRLVQSSHDSIRIDIKKSTNTAEAEWTETRSRMKCLPFTQKLFSFPSSKIYWRIRKLLSFARLHLNGQSHSSKDHKKSLLGKRTVRKPFLPFFALVLLPLEPIRDKKSFAFALKQFFSPQNFPISAQLKVDRHGNDKRRNDRARAQSLPSAGVCGKCRWKRSRRSQQKTKINCRHYFLSPTTLAIDPIRYHLVYQPLWGRRWNFYRY